MMIDESESLTSFIFSLNDVSTLLDDYIKKGGKLHTRKQCRTTKAQGGPKNCTIHSPSKHKMQNWPRILRVSTLIERQCLHGVGHPDPDSVKYLSWRTDDNGWGIHGCDGCCRET